MDPSALDGSRLPCSTRRSAMAIRVTDPYARPFLVMTSAQSIPSFLPFSQSPPSEMAPSSRSKLVRYDLSKARLLDGRAVSQLLGGLATLAHDVAGLVEPCLVTSQLERDKDEDSDQQPRSDDERRQVVGRRRQRDERRIHRVDEDEARTHREHQVEDPIELLPPLPPVVEDDADVRHHVDEDHAEDEDEPDGEDEDLVGAEDPREHQTQQDGQRELNVDRDGRRLAYGMNSAD